VKKIAGTHMSMSAIIDNAVPTRESRAVGNARTFHVGEAYSHRSMALDILPLSVAPKKMGRRRWRGICFVIRITAFSIIGISKSTPATMTASVARKLCWHYCERAMIPNG